MRIAEAISAEEGSQKVEAVRPDLVLLDITLPGESGLKLVRKIKKSRAGIITVILTSHDLPEYRKAAYQSGADYFLAKGTSSIEELVALIRRLFPKPAPDLGAPNGSRSPEDPLIA